jgi:uncharacterized secreted protein with C-terminal beta-propeller domain
MMKSAWWGGYGESSTGMRVYDLSDMQEPHEVYNYSITGNYFSSRMIGDWVYLVANEYVYVYDENYSNVTVPIICRNGQEQKMPADEIYYVDCPEASYNYNNMLALNLRDGRSSEKSFMMGSASEMYVSVENMYVVNTNQWRFMWFGWGGYGYQNTTVNKFSISDGEIAHVAKGEVPGYILNQFSMDESNGYFRIATTKGNSWEGNSTNNVYVLDSAMNVVGRLEDLAKGETIYSVRFMGSRCYMVTFVKVDPLFVIDLGDPSNPRVLGELKIPGYSEYLHPYDENHIIGIGKEAIEATEENSGWWNGGNFAWYQGIKIALFNVTDPSNPVEVDNTIIGDRGTYSEALDDHHAFLFSREKSLLVIPATVYYVENKEGNSASEYGEPVYEGAIAFRLTLEGGFEKIGSVTHQTTSPSGNPDEYWYPDYDLQVRRSLYIDNILYTMSNGMVKSSDLANGLAQIGSVKL